MIKRLLLSLICIWSLTALSAQTVYPIRSYTILTPPMPYSLSSFAGETGKMQLNINVDDISLDNYPVKFRLFITGNGIRLYTKPNMIQDPYYLFGGMTETLTGLDLAPLFDPNNLIFEGFSKRQYEVEGRLPEGVYQVKVEVWDYHHNINISQAIPGVAVMYLTRAPQLTLPFDNSELDILNNLNIRFSWMGFVPNDPLSNIVYEFKLWEILPDGRSKYEVANSVAPIFTQQTSEAYLVYDMGMPPLQTGRSYAWQVQAVDLHNRARFQNDGYSDVFQFRYGASCPNATISIKEIGNTQATFNISMSKGAQLYRIFYKTEDTEEWQSTETDNRSYTLTNLDENTTYQVKVVCLCGNDESDESSVTTFKTKWDIDYTCGTNLAGVDLSNTEPLTELKRFGLFKAADFTIEVVEVSGSNGRFSGSGFALVPYLGFIKFGVDFDNVFINSDRRMTEGEVKFQFNKDTGLMLDLGSVMAALTPDNDNTITVDPSEAVDQSTDYVIKVDDEISSVVVTDSTVTVVTVGGDSKTYTANPGQTVGVVSPDGKTVYVADTSTGQVYTAPNPNTANTNANSVVSPAQSGEYGVTATFSPASNMRYGYDAVGNGTNKPNTYFNTDKQGNKIAWKSLGNGRADYVDVNINGADPDSIRFLRSSGMLASTIDQGGKKQLLLTGMAGGQEETLTAAFVKTTQVNDSTQNETLTEAGALGLVNYDYLLKTVHLIPVNGAKCPNNAGAVRDLLNQYYGSAVVEWEVRVEKGFETDKINSDGFNTEDKTLLSKYTSDMNTIISQYKKQDGVSINKDHLYLFFVECTTNKQGFMPLTGRYGFIFNFGSNAETIAHELGHGAFNLWHTFSDKGQYKLTEGSTPNLMDYSGGTELWKYQWDLIHDPQTMLFAWAQDEEEGAAINLDLIISNSQESGIEFDGSEIITCITPAGKPYTLPSNIKSLDFTSDNEDFPDGALLNFTTTDGKTFVAVYKRSNKEFLGYTELINPNATDKKEKINYKDDAKKIPDCRLDNTTKTLTDQSRVLLGKKIDCAINVYQVEYSEVANKTGVSEEGYCGSGTYSSEPLAYDVEGKTPITVGDNTACLNKYAKEFYQGHLTTSSAYKETLLRIANLLSSIEGGGDAMFTDYEKYCNKENSRRYYGNPDLWGTPEDYQLFEKALEAYINKKETLEQLILAENDRDKLTDLAWLLVDKWSESISYDVRLHVIKKLSEGAMYGNDLFGNGQEYLAIRLIYGITDVQEQAKFLTDITKDGLLETLFSRIGDEGGDDNFTTFIMLLSQMAKNNTETFGIQGDPMFIWVGDLFRSDKVKINFTTDGQVKLQGFIKEYTCYPIYYGGGSSCTSTWKSTTDEYTLSPFTFIPVKFPKGEKFLESLSDDGSNITFVPVIYLKALNAKRNTDVTKTTVGVAVDVASLCIGIGELNMAIKAVKGGATAIKILRLTALATDVIITSSDIIITLVEDDIKELDGGQEFLDKYRIYSALIGLTAFGADNLTKSPETLAGLSDSWRKFKGKYGSDPKKVINAVGGPERYNKIENIVDNTEYALRQTEHADLVSKTPDLDANYVEAIADIASDWKKNALGQQIDELTDAPLGYQFYRRDGNKWIRRLDADNPKTPRLTVENGKIVMYDLLQNADEVKDLLKTNANTAFFWSGRTNGIGGEVRALEVAKSKGGTTLEGLLADKGIKMPAWSDNPGIWDDVSAEYANQVSGEVRAVVGKELRPDNVWENIELPRLKTNAKVTKITTIDPETLEETIIFTR